MNEIKTYEDGWDCVPKLKNTVRVMDLLRDHVYEIKHCVRSSDLDYMVQAMKSNLQVAMDILDEIDTEETFITVEDED
jgi:hypothetical protein